MRFAIESPMLECQAEDSQTNSTLREAVLVVEKVELLLQDTHMIVQDLATEEADLAVVTMKV